MGRTEQDAPGAGTGNQLIASREQLYCPTLPCLQCILYLLQRPNSRFGITDFLEFRNVINKGAKTLELLTYVERVVILCTPFFKGHKTAVKQYPHMMRDSRA